MELEFDKEIDAILRRARPGAGPEPRSSHLDADVIAAFAENSVPERTRLTYVRHLADCDRCRRILSGTIPVSDTAAVEAVSPVEVPQVEASVPWYNAVFKLPGLAVAMGALVLVFSGVLGFLIFRNNLDSQNAVVSQVSEQERPAAAPLSSNDASQSDANAMSTATPEPMASANTADPMPYMPQAMANTSAGTLARGDVKKAAPEQEVAKATDADLSASRLTDLPSAAAPPPPAPRPAAGVTDGLAATETKNDSETKRAERSDQSLALKSKEMDAARGRDLPPAAAKSGPGRSGPVQMQSNQNARNAVQMSVTRSSGGRKFANRDGAWYDTAYNGQATTNVRRGSDEFKKLDPGLRSIANDIEGVVVVVWKSKAYRIQ